MIAKIQQRLEQFKDEQIIKNKIKRLVRGGRAEIKEGKTKRSKIS